MMELRGQYVSRAEGDVLEIGLGSGLNLPHYEGVASVTGVDPGVEVTDLAKTRMEAAPFPVNLLTASAEEIPVDDARFDSIVCTWTLCSIPNPYRAVSEMRRALKPGGKLYFVEHGRSSEPNIARWQARIEPIWKKIGGGCHLTRRADELLQDAGFQIAEKVAEYKPGPKVAAFMIHGVAIA